MSDLADLWRTAHADERAYLDRVAGHRQEELQRFIEAHRGRVTVRVRDHGSCIRLTMNGVTMDYWPRREKWHDITHQRRGCGFAGAKAALERGTKRA